LQNCKLFSRMSKRRGTRLFKSKKCDAFKWLYNYELFNAFTTIVLYISQYFL